MNKNINMILQSHTMVMTITTDAALNNLKATIIDGNYNVDKYGNPL